LVSLGDQERTGSEKLPHRRQIDAVAIHQKAFRFSKGGVDHVADGLRVFWIRDTNQQNSLPLGSVRVLKARADHILILGSVRLATIVELHLKFA
jgi:hypothetical protein